MGEDDKTDWFRVAEPQVFSVSDLTRYVREILESSIGAVRVEGEVCNHRRQSSGHQYFTLKDDKCQISCVLFHRPALRLRQIQVEDGMQVQVRGNLTVYEARGQYQINVQSIQPAGAGLLQAKFEALKRKLEAEGLFDPARKKTLPKFPASIAIVTSPTGAALRDMLNILERRAPWLRIIIHPVRVQGDGAAQDIARAIAELNSDALPGVDVIVVGRGGGSAEDLAQFNEEILARAIFDSAIPVVSAVGHEIDFTIADFTADLRAPTPSAAAELIAPDRAEMLRRLGANQSLLTRKVGDILAQWKSRLDFSARGALLREPRSLVAEGWQSLDLAERSLDYALQTQMAQSRKRIDDVSGRLREHRPDHHLEIRRLAIADLSARMRQHTAARFQMARNSLDRLNAMLRVLAPEATLLRGFSITTDASGALVRSAGQVKKGGKIHTRLSDGSLSSVVEATAL